MTRYGQSHPDIEHIPTLYHHVPAVSKLSGGVSPSLDPCFLLLQNCRKKGGVVFVFNWFYIANRVGNLFPADSITGDEDHNSSPLQMWPGVYMVFVFNWFYSKNRVVNFFSSVPSKEFAWTEDQLTQKHGLQIWANSLKNRREIVWNGRPWNAHSFNLSPRCFL